MDVYGALPEVGMPKALWAASTDWSPVASKSDLAAMRQATKADLDSVRNEVTVLG